MSQQNDRTKIEVTIGNIQFAGAGEEKWLSSQLDKIIDLAKTIDPSVLTNNEGFDEYECNENFELEATPKSSCTIIKMQRKGIYWYATARCSNGDIKTGESVNKISAKQLACVQCK